MRNNDIVYRKYKSMEKGALMRGIEFKITMNEYSQFHGKPCHYCGIQSIGLDRIDSAICYRLDNVVPCCTVCNMMKGTLERDAFITHCKRITDNHGTVELPFVETDFLDTHERELIQQAFSNCKYNVSKTANVLGITRGKLRYRMQRHGIAR